MPYGIQVYNASGGIIFNSEESFGGVYAGKVSVGPTTSTTIYMDGASGRPNCIGKTLRAVEFGGGRHNWSVTQASTPYITFTARTISGIYPYSANTTLHIFAV